MQEDNKQRTSEDFRKEISFKVWVYCQEKEHEEMRLIFFFLLSLMVLGIVNAEYTIKDDLVYVNDSGVYLGATPHTVTNDGEVVIGLISKQFGGNIDVAYGFNLSNTIPSSPMYWGVNANGTNDWKPLSGFEQYDFTYDGMNKWYVYRNFNVQEDKLYQMKFYLDIIGSGKYDVCIKPSAESFTQAINNNHLLCLDPWWNETQYVHEQNKLSNYWDDIKNSTLTTAYVRPIFLYEDNLVDGWIFDITGSPTPSMIGSRSGTVSGATWNSSGKNGGSYTFDARAEYIRSSATLPVMSAYTFSVWAKFNSSAGGTADMIFACPTNDPSLSRYSNETMLIYADNTLRIAKGQIADTNWHHHVLVNTGSRLIYYLDNTIQANISLTTSSSACTFNIGDNSAGTDYFYGNIDEMYIYDRGLSSAEISKLYSNNLSRRYEQVNVQHGYIVGDNLISMLRFENNTLDELYQNSGVNSGAAYTASGKISGAYDFAQNTDYISIADSASIDNNQQMSINMWYKGTNTISNAGMILKSNGATDYEWLITGSAVGTSLDCVALDTAGGGVATARKTLTTAFNSSWHMITCVINNNVNITLYVDGVVVAYDSTWVGTWNYEGAGVIQIGDRQDGGVGKIGLYDEISIWNTTLTQAQITNMYTNQSAGYYYNTSANRFASIINTTSSNINWVVPTVNYSGTAPTINLSTNNRTTYTTITNGTNSTVTSGKWLSFDIFLGLNTSIMNLGMLSGYYIANSPPNITLIQPLNNTDSTNTLVIFEYMINDTDDSFLNVSLYIDDVLNISNLSVSSDSVILNVIDGFSIGLHSWFVNVTDGTDVVQSETWYFNITPTPSTNVSANITELENKINEMEEENTMISIMIIYMFFIILSIFLRSGALLMLSALFGFGVFIAQPYDVLINVIGLGINFILMFVGYDMIMNNNKK